MLEVSKKMLSNHSLNSLAKQAWLAAYVGNSDWLFSPLLGQISFGDKFCWTAHTLGAEDDDRFSWRWAWANKASGIPTSLLSSALMMQMLGEAQCIPELTEPEVSLDRIDGHTIAIIAKFDVRNAISIAAIRIARASATNTGIRCNT